MSVRVGWWDAAGGWLGSTGWDCSEDEERECFSAIRMADADFWDCCDSIGARYRSVVAAKVAGGEPPGGVGACVLTPAHFSGASGGWSALDSIVTFQNPPAFTGSILAGGGE